MGGMSSPTKSIEHMNFNPMPRKPTKGTLVEVDGVVLFVGENGGLYTTAKPLNKKVHCQGHWKFSDAMTEALDLMKLLTPEDKAKHQAYLKRLEERSEIVSVLGEIHRASETHPAVINRKAAIKLWDSLDYYGQREAQRYSYMPKGAKMKPEPKP